MPRQFALVLLVTVASLGVVGVYRATTYSFSKARRLRLAAKSERKAARHRAEKRRKAMA